ncbi:MAG: ATP-binding protein [Ilumatobacteraceae bacterium]
MLRIYLGAMPGVGTTRAMLDEGLRRHLRNTDVVIGIIETEGRSPTPEWQVAIERAPTRTTDDGADMDVDWIIARAPAVLLVDELGRFDQHGHGRWEDVDRCLASGIDVVATLDAIGVAELHDPVCAIRGVAVTRAVPDSFLNAASQIELVDMSAEALRRRFAHGHIYPSERVNAVLANMYRPEVIGAVRQLTLAWMTRRAEEELNRHLPARPRDDGRVARERVVVALGGEGGEHLVRRAARIADRSGGSLVGVHVMSPQRQPGPDLEHQRQLLTSLGGTYREVRGDDVATALHTYLRVEQATQLVIGARPPSSSAHGAILRQLVHDVGAMEVHIVPTGESLLSSRRLELPRARAQRSRRLTIAGWALCMVGLPLATLLFSVARTHVSLGSELLIDLCIVMAVAALAGLRAGLVASIGAFGLTNWFLTPPLHTLSVGQGENVVALSVFVLVTVVVSVLVDRAARRSREAASARSEAAALARSAATLVGALDPLPDLLEQVRATFGLASASVLERSEGGWWPTHLSGFPELTDPAEGASIDLSADGRLKLVVSGADFGSEHLEVLRAFADQLAMAVEARRLRSEAADAELLVQADALRAALLQAVSHDFRTPLATIKASASGLLDTGAKINDADRRVLLSDIENASDRLDRMVRDLLDMSRLQAGAISLALAPVALEEVVAAAIGGIATAKERVDVDVSESLPLVLADPALLERAVANLVSNALVWSPADRSVRVEAGSVGGSVDLRVVDHGPGVPMGERERIFVPFQRLGDRSHDAGVGLGLAIAKGFVESMGARITLDDTPGGGLTMTVRLHLADAGSA